MTIEHTPKCDKITCKAFGMNRQAVPVSGTGHALVDLAGVVHLAPHQAQQGAQEDRVLSQVTALQVCDGLKGVDATHLQGRTPGGQLSGTDRASFAYVAASSALRQMETREDLATPKIIGSQKQDHWILDKKNKQLIRVHITPVHTKWSQGVSNQS